MLPVITGGESVADVRRKMITDRGIYDSFTCSEKDRGKAKAVVVAAFEQAFAGVVFVAGTRTVSDGFIVGWVVADEKKSEAKAFKSYHRSIDAQARRALEQAFPPRK